MSQLIHIKAPRLGRNWLGVVYFRLTSGGLDNAINNGEHAMKIFKNSELVHFTIGEYATVALNH